MNEDQSINSNGNESIGNLKWNKFQKGFAVKLCKLFPTSELLKWWIYWSILFQIEIC